MAKVSDIEAVKFDLEDILFQLDRLTHTYDAPSLNIAVEHLENAATELEAAELEAQI